MEELGTLHRFLHRRIFSNPSLERGLVDEFNRFYYDSYVWNETRWMGARVMKCPLDLFVYQELIYETKPDIIIETGTAFGGSALFLAHIFDAMGRGKVITIDIDPGESRPQHKRIAYVTGSSVADDVVGKVKKELTPGARVMAILDSDHTRDHVLKEMECWGPLVSKGCYLVVEDSNINGHPVYPHFGPGPMEALRDYLSANPGQFEIDREREKFFVTFNPSGFLKKIS